MKARCPYCTFLADPRGLKSHMRLVHPNMIAEFGTSHAEPLSGVGGIRKEMLIPENPQENRYYAKLKNIQRGSASKKLVIIPSKTASKEVVKMSVQEEKIAEEIRHEYEYECPECEFEFDELSWDKGDACCPKCGVHLDE